MNNEEKIFDEIKADAKSNCQKEERFKPIKLDELFSIEFPENKWVVEKIVPHQGITIISGAPASYKTWLLLRMAIDIAEGGKLFGQFQCEQNKVLIIDEENHLRLVRERLELLGADPALPISFLSQKGFLVSEKESVETIIEICDAEGIDVIFIDSLVRINEAEENDASQMSKVFRDIRKFCQAGKTVVLTHHEKKEGIHKGTAQNRLRGSSDISAAVDAHLALKRDKEDKTKIIIEQAKLRADKEIDTFEAVVRNVDDKVELHYLGLRSEDTTKKEKARDVILAVLEEEENGLAIGEICKLVKESENIGEKSIRDAIKELLKEESLLEKQGDGNSKICFLPRFYQKSEAIQESLI